MSVVAEKQAVDLVQHTPISKLDADLPSSPFGPWFSQLMGPKAVVVWQLAECGERKERSERDSMACAEASAILPDGRQVIVAVKVGTFKKGISGKPAFSSAVIRQNDHLYLIQRLRDLPNLVRTPESLPGQLSEVVSNGPRIALRSGSTDVSKLNLSQTSTEPDPSATGKTTTPESEPLPVGTTASTEPEPSLTGKATTPAPDTPSPGTTPSTKQEEPKEPAEPQKPQKVLEGVLQGRALVKINPIYPANARSLNASGSVEVKVLVSEDGRVIDAKAVSGHPVLRGPAVEAARKWVFTPTTLNGVPVKVESSLTFVFR